MIGYRSLVEGSIAFLTHGCTFVCRWDIMRCWVKEHPVKASKEKTAGAAILAKEPKLKANFSRCESALIKSQVCATIPSCVLYIYMV